MAAMVNDDFSPVGIYVKALIMVYWDIENTQVPSATDPTTISAIITTRLRLLGYQGTIKIIAVAANHKRIHPDINQCLKDNRVNVIFVGSEKKQASDDKIRNLVYQWTRSRRSPANLMLLSGDGGFYRMLEQLMLHDYNVLIAYRPGSFNDILLQQCTTHWLWNDFLLPIEEEGGQ